MHRSGALIGKLLLAQEVKKFHGFYGSLSIAVFKILWAKIHPELHEKFYVVTLAFQTLFFDLQR